MLLALLLVACAVVQISRGAGAKNDGNQKELERLEAESNAAHVRSDAAALDRIFAEDLLVLVPGCARGRKRIPSECHLGPHEVRGVRDFRNDDPAYDETAIVTGRLRRTRVIAGATADDDWRFTKVLSAS